MSQESDNSNDEYFKTPELPIESIKGPAAPPLLTNTTFQNAQVPSTIEYQLPSWSCSIPEDFQYSIEVIKSGQIVEIIDLKNSFRKSFITIGRFEPCDIVLDHPSVSRHHCVLQYGILSEGMGWYLFDMDSTHGTKVNKKAVLKRFYVRLRTGSVFQIAGSTRLFSLCGPDSETELKKTVEITKERREAKINKDDEPSKPETVKFYAKDPLRWLDDYLEREGLPMNFQFSNSKSDEKGSDCTCSIELADDIDSSGSIVYGTGPTRKEAQYQCALLACEKLDSIGILRELMSRREAKKQSLAENDFCEEDEDEFYDRTEQFIEQRKRRRMRIEADSLEENKVAHTHDELKESFSKAKNQLDFIEKELLKLLEKNSCVVNGQEVVNNVLSFSTRMAISQMKAKQKNLDTECTRLQKLIKASEPTFISNKHFSIKQTKLNTNQEKPIDKVVVSELKVNLEEKQNVSTSSIITNQDLDIKPQTSVADLQNIEKSYKVETEDEPQTSTNIVHTENEVKKALTRSRNFDPILPSKPKEWGLVQKSDLKLLKHPTSKKRHMIIDEEEEEIDSVKNSQSSTTLFYEKEMDPDTYATWVPPEGQSGDGRTKLNEKFAGRY